MRRLGLWTLLAAMTVACVIGSGVALADEGGTVCPNAEVRIEKSTLLPDCRAYEQVSPVDKDYSVGFSEPFVAFGSEEGDAAAFTTNGPLPGSPAGAIQNVYVSRRGASGWDLTPLSPPQTPVPGATTFPFFVAFSQDVRYSLVETANPTLVPEAQPGLANLYAYDNVSHEYRLISVPQFDGPNRVFFDFGGATPDFSRVFFNSFEPLVPDAPTSAAYEWHEGELRLLTVLPNGEPTQGPIGTGNVYRAFHAISEDGNRAYFTRLGGELYLREGGSKTIEVSASRRAIPDPGPPTPHFWQATADGGTTFFTDGRALTEDAELGSGDNLYAFDVAGNSLTDLTPAAQAEVLGLVGASDDGSYVYFAARGDLGGGATSGAPNLYLWHGGEIQFLATLDEGDSADWQFELRGLTSQVTPDGRHLLLTSLAPLTGYDNINASSGVPDPEAYLYSADGDELDCVSCHPDGSSPEGGATIAPISSPLGMSRYTERFVTEDGLVVFDTIDSLVPRDTNGRFDVYAYEEGKLSLLSTGTSEFPSRFADMSANGKDIFLVTAEQLLKSDHDGYGDLYDARLGGGYAAPVPPIPPCAGGECIRNASVPPAAPNLGSSTYRGAGNAKPRRRCGKHARRVRRHGKVRCVRKHGHGKHHRGARKAGSIKGGGK